LESNYFLVAAVGILKQLRKVRLVRRFSMAVPSSTGSPSTAEIRSDREAESPQVLFKGRRGL
jgi:hypothetical protein